MFYRWGKTDYACMIVNELFWVFDFLTEAQFITNKIVEHLQPKQRNLILVVCVSSLEHCWLKRVVIRSYKFLI